MPGLKETKYSEALSVKRDLAEWFATPLGQSLLEFERGIVEKTVSRHFGFHQLELLLHTDYPLGEHSLLGHRIPAVPEPQDSRPEGTLICQSEELPLFNDSIDLVIMHHTLDVAAKPHQTLREAARVLRSGGKMVVIGFNPVSLWGIRRWMSRKVGSPWSARFITASRLDDWLNLLEFSVNEIKYNYFTPPIANPRWQSRLAALNRWGKKLRLPLGAFYVIEAQKRVGGAIKLKPRWQRSTVAGGAAAVHQFNSYRKDEEH